MADAAAIATVRPPAGRRLGWWGMTTLVMTEAMLFALLLFTYVYLATRAEQWPPEGVAEPELLRSGIRSLLLFASSATMSWADRGIRRGCRGRFETGLVVTFLLAAVFMAGHVEEMRTLPAEFTWASHAYGSLFYTITNFHAAHLTVGMALLAFTYLASRRGHFSAEEHLGATTTSIYWHFVDVVWVFVYTLLYLWPHLR
ncbi:MAG: cytochrome c oxidase subunit 3 [Egibacteraceae bacterium]